MRALITLLLFTGCKSSPENGYAVDLTIAAGPSLSAGVISSIQSLVVDVSGDESAERSYSLDHPFHLERLIYSPRADSNSITFSVLARDASNGPVAFGDVTVRLKHGATTQATVTLGSEIPPLDMAVSDLGTQDLAAVDLAGEDLAGVDFSADDLSTPPDMVRVQPLSVTKAGAAATTGVVSTSGGEINCGSTCSASFAEGSMVTLTASVVPKSGTWFQGWSGDCAANNQPTCTVSMSAARNVTATFVNVNYVFLMAAPQQLPFGANANAALTNADTACNTAAAGKLPGHFKAYLSVGATGTTINAVDRLATARGWIRPDELPSFDTIQSGIVFYPPTVNENNVRMDPDTFVATGTDAAGNYATNATCQDWTVASGSSAYNGVSGSAAWSIFGLKDCALNSGQVRLYCFGTDFTATVTPPKTSGRIIWLSTGTVNSNQGIGAADSLCQTEAGQRGFPNAAMSDTYRALMATSSPAASALSRFDVSAGSSPWVRADGIPVVLAAADLGNPAKPLLAPLGDGFKRPVWTGANPTLTDPGSSTSTCTNWTALTGSAVTGNSDLCSAGAFDNSSLGTEPDSCNAPWRVYCLQR